VFKMSGKRHRRREAAHPGADHYGFASTGLGHGVPLKPAGSASGARQTSWLTRLPFGKHLGANRRGTLLLAICDFRKVAIDIEVTRFNRQATPR